MKRLLEYLLPESRLLRIVLFGLLAYSFLVLGCALILDYHHSPAYYPAEG